MSNATTWVITSSAPEQLAGLAKSVKAAGGTVQSQLKELGVLIVQGSATQAAAWRKLPGVAAVEADQNVDIGPPGSDPT